MCQQKYQNPIRCHRSLFHLISSNIHFLIDPKWRKSDRPPFQDDVGEKFNFHKWNTCFTVRFGYLKTTRQNLSFWRVRAQAAGFDKIEIFWNILFFEEICTTVINLICVCVHWQKRIYRAKFFSCVLVYDVHVCIQTSGIYKERQQTGEKVSNRWLQEEARRLAVQMCPQIFLDAYKSARCMFSEHWLHNFKKRYGISLKVIPSSAPLVHSTSLDSAELKSSMSLPGDTSVFSFSNVNESPISVPRSGHSIFRPTPNYPVSLLGDAMQQQPSISPLASTPMHYGDVSGVQTPTNKALQLPGRVNLAEWYQAPLSRMNNNVGEHNGRIFQQNEPAPCLENCKSKRGDFSFTMWYFRRSYG